MQQDSLEETLRCHTQHFAHTYKASLGGTGAKSSCVSEIILLEQSQMQILFWNTAFSTIILLLLVAAQPQYCINSLHNPTPLAPSLAN